MESLIRASPTYAVDYVKTTLYFPIPSVPVPGVAGAAVTDAHLKVVLSTNPHATLNLAAHHMITAHIQTKALPANGLDWVVRAV